MMHKLRELRGLLIETGIWLGLAAVAYGLTYQFDEPLDLYRFGAAGWPRVVIVLLALCALANLALEVRGQWQKRAAPTAGREREEGTAAFLRGDLPTHVKRLATFSIPLLYVYLIPRMGFYVATPLFVACYMSLLGERRFPYLLGASLLIYALMVLLFTKLLFVGLPVGNWPGFYAFNNFFLSLIK
ncbi:MAG: tripartite tricarboxylate transporter TctB family protein [Candidatus Methylomirabilales bacterium]